MKELVGKCVHRIAVLSLTCIKMICFPGKNEPICNSSVHENGKSLSLGHGFGMHWPE